MQFLGKRNLIIGIGHSHPLIGGDMTIFVGPCYTCETRIEMTWNVWTVIYGFTKANSLSPCLRLYTLWSLRGINFWIPLGSGRSVLGPYIRRMCSSYQTLLLIPHYQLALTACWRNLLTFIRFNRSSKPHRFKLLPQFLTKDPRLAHLWVLFKSERDDFSSYFDMMTRPLKCNLLASNDIV